MQKDLVFTLSPCFYGGYDWTQTSDQGIMRKNNQKVANV